jgi:hypothetical protein
VPQLANHIGAEIPQVHAAISRIRGIRVKEQDRPLPVPGSADSVGKAHLPKGAAEPYQRRYRQQLHCFGPTLW